MKVHLTTSSKVLPQSIDFGKIYDRYHKKVYEYFFYRTNHDIELAEDLTDETFLRAFAHFSQFQDRGYAYVTYLMTIAHNLLVNHYRKQKSIPWSQLSAEEMKNEASDDARDFLKQEDERLAEERLSEFERNLFAMKYRQGLSIAAIAQAIGRTPAAVKTLLFRIRNKMKHNFGLN